MNSQGLDSTQQHASVQDRNAKREESMFYLQLNAVHRKREKEIFFDEETLGLLTPLQAGLGAH